MIKKVIILTVILSGGLFVTGCQDTLTPGTPTTPSTPIDACVAREDRCIIARDVCEKQADDLVIENYRLSNWKPGMPCNQILATDQTLKTQCGKDHTASYTECIVPVVGSCQVVQPCPWPVFSAIHQCTEGELRCVENYQDCVNNPDHKEDPKFALGCYYQQYSDLEKTGHCPFTVPSCNQVYTLL